MQSIITILRKELCIGYHALLLDRSPTRKRDVNILGLKRIKKFKYNSTSEIVYSVPQLSFEKEEFVEMFKSL